MDERGSWFLACRPVPRWPEKVVCGYCALVPQEVKDSRAVFEEISGAFEPWFRMLALLEEVLRREHDFAGKADPQGIAWLLRLRLAAVAAGTARMVLDAALAGYYAQGFALVRHMLET